MCEKNSYRNYFEKIATPNFRYPTYFVKKIATPKKIRRAGPTNIKRPRAKLKIDRTESKNLGGSEPK